MSSPPPPLDVAQPHPGSACSGPQELHRRTQLQPEPAKTKALQTVIEMKHCGKTLYDPCFVYSQSAPVRDKYMNWLSSHHKLVPREPSLCIDPAVIFQDTKIASLERNIRDLEDEIQMLKTNGVLNTEDREEEIKQIEVYKSHSKFMKNKIDQLKQELSKKESELLALQTKLETLSNQNSDCKQHIEVLKESLTAKEQRAAILQTETTEIMDWEYTEGLLPFSEGFAGCDKEQLLTHLNSVPAPFFDKFFQWIFPSDFESPCRA
ncbi:ERC protein 2 [Varanus komodoensis]|nr:ERC protein 2 [Varanus komodoensis]